LEPKTPKEVSWRKWLVLERITPVWFIRIVDKERYIFRKTETFARFCIKKWKRYIEQRKKIEANKTTLEHFRILKILGNCWTAWTKWKLAKVHHRRSVWKKHLDRWWKSREDNVNHLSLHSCPSFLMMMLLLLLDQGEEFDELGSEDGAIFESKESCQATH
jgi:hypothetical protein